MLLQVVIWQKDVFHTFFRNCNQYYTFIKAGHESRGYLGHNLGPNKTCLLWVSPIRKHVYKINTFNISWATTRYFQSLKTPEKSFVRVSESKRGTVAQNIQFTKTTQDLLGIKSSCIMSQNCQTHFQLKEYIKCDWLACWTTKSVTFSNGVNTWTFAICQFCMHKSISSKNCSEKSTIHEKVYLTEGYILYSFFEAHKIPA